jgi:hypothetical protein
MSKPDEVGFIECNGTLKFHSFLRKGDRGTS